MNRTTKLILFIPLGLLVAAALFTSVYTVDESEQAVIETFGQVEEGIITSGLHFKLPWPMQQVRKFSKETFSLQFGYEEVDGEVTKEYPEDTKMITGDENIVLADMVVQWKITDPKRFLYATDDPEQILYNATSASLRGIIGTSTIDESLTSGKAEIEAQVRDLLVKLIEDYDIGVSILAVKLQDVDLPNKEVRRAFTKVTDARETMNTKINEARKYSNKKTEEAEGEKDAIISRAEGDKAARIEKARGDVATFNALYSEYKNQPAITRERLVLETLDQVLPHAEIYIMSDEGGTLKYLPIRPAEAKPAPVQEGGKKSEQQ
ncbi:FtsH protease activity modulator HflK [Pseudalkalibacillus sp. SCS-8]|uniref:FtsH protease activity modulator HflK n=1 Tax=Pseudalkalibacillus nanhaiensis TaxID=3115291 RepID=UPI0039C922D3